MLYECIFLKIYMLKHNRQYYCTWGPGSPLSPLAPAAPGPPLMKKIKTCCLNIQKAHEMNKLVFISIH